ncbi:hypothetical protein ILUMI_15921 [Ignelater luminosus]|uniref:Transposase n=1 Tax=Ignelater luminosus TaxID=2038154 RepID=A0A8K0CRZ9_IGNLU|nr:hypothetical protein ILUMI_15921 [Ignelater luminosus]
MRSLGIVEYSDHMKVPSGLIRRGKLLEVWHNKPDKENRIDAIDAYIVQKLKLHDCTEPVKDILRKKSENICKQMRQKWQKSHSSMYNLGHKYSQCLDGYFIFDDIMTHMPTTAKAVGKPAKRFSESSDVTKRRRIHTLLEKSAEELSFATQVTLRAQGL